MMHKHEKRGLVPKLRFPEFREAGEWEPKSIGQLGAVVTGSTPSTAQPEYYGGERLFVSPADISDDRFIEKTKTTLTEPGFRETRPIKANSILFVCIGSTIGKIAQNRYECATNQQINSVIPNSENSGSFVYYALSGISDKLANLAGKQAVPIVNKSLFSSVELPVPKLPEQTRIADCLASLDELITLEAQKLDTLQTHKKGLMQQLFPAEGETLPKLRFPEFRDGGEWEEKTLGQVAKYENGKAHEQDITEIGEFVVVNSKFISTEGEVRKFTDTAFCIAEKDDILMVLSDVPNGRAIAKCFLVDSDHLYTVNQRICKLTPYKAVSILLFYVLNRNSYFLAFDDGVKQTNLKKDDVLDCPILLPKNLKEQQKIADCLASLDDLITAQTQKIAALKTQKKGLMQQLFPVLGEVTA